MSALINPQDEEGDNASAPLVAPRVDQAAIDSEEFEPGGARTCCCFIDILLGVKIIGITWMVEVLLLFFQINSVTDDGG